MEGTTLLAASRQWASRPADQRFNSLEALHAAVTGHRNMATEARGLDLRNMKLTVGPDATGANVPMLQGRSGLTAEFSHYAFGQFARRLDAPAAYLRQLSPGLVCANLNDGLRRLAEGRIEGADDPTGLTVLFSQGRGTDEGPHTIKAGPLTVRAVTTDKYTRIWNADITRRLIQMTEQRPEWQPAPAAFDGSRGLYASDKDMFAFLVNNDRRVFQKDPNGGFGKGFFVTNSEVGDASFKLTTFLYQYICGNHMVWGAKGVQEIRIPHIGNADARAFSRLSVELRKYADASVSDDEQRIERMRRLELGATKDEVLDKLFGLGVTRALGNAAVQLAEKREDWYGNPRSVFGQVSALTEIARDMPNADKRVETERMAGKVASIAF
jgi:hypothetical protein